MKKGVIIIISAVAICLIAACVLLLTGVIKFPKTNEPEAEKEAAFYVEYMDSNMLVDLEGCVTGSSEEKPDDIPEVSGISFPSIVVGETLSPIDEYAYQYAIKIVDALKRNLISVNEVYISSDLEAVLYINKVKVLLGKDKQTEEKIKEMGDFYDKFKDLSGTLDMQELSQNNIGYSLKPDK